MFEYRTNAAGIAELTLLASTTAGARCARAILRDAVAACPVDTGELRDSLTMEREGSTWYIGSRCDHAIYPEMGTRRMSPRSYLRPALYRKRVL